MAKDRTSRTDHHLPRHPFRWVAGVFVLRGGCTAPDQPPAVRGENATFDP